MDGQSCAMIQNKELYVITLYIAGGSLLQRVRPFGTIDLFEEKVYIQTGKIKAVAQQMKTNPKVEISAISQDGIWYPKFGYLFEH